MIFERQPRETAKAYAAFQVYLGQGPERSLAATAKHLGKCKKITEKWSKKYDWQARVAAHGDHLTLVDRARHHSRPSTISASLGSMEYQFARCGSTRRAVDPLLFSAGKKLELPARQLLRDNRFTLCGKFESARPALGCMIVQSPLPGCPTHNVAS
jgi:hypothetical protein